MKIANQKNVTINNVVAADATKNKFSKYISLPFQPDQMNVKIVTYNQTAAITEVFILNCITINEILASFVDNSSQPQNSSFSSKNYPNHTEWQFEIIRLPTGVLSDQTNNSLSFQLEFIQYSDK